MKNIILAAAAFFMACAVAGLLIVMRPPANETASPIARAARHSEPGGTVGNVLAAMDRVNADAFQEAYKDLVNLANVALGGGRPVR